MRRIEAERRQHRRDLPFEDRRGLFTLSVAEIGPADKMDPLLGELRSNHLAVTGRLLSQHRGNQLPLPSQQVAGLVRRQARVVSQRPN